MVQNRSQFSDLFLEDMLPALRSIVVDKFAQKRDPRAMLFNMASSDRGIEQSTTFGTYPAAPEKSEGSSVTYFDAKQGFDKTYTMVTYALGMITTEEMIEDNKFALIQKLAKALGKSMFETTQIVSAAVWNNGFTTNGADGVPLFATNHPLLGGGTEQNTPTVGVDLSITALEDAMTLMSDTRDDENKHIALTPKILLIAPALKFRAREILGSDLKSGTANNDLNALKEEGLTIVEWDFLTDTGAWAVGPDPSDSDFWFYNRRPMRVEGDFDFDTGNGKTKSTMRFDVDYGDWRSWYAST